MFKDCYQRGFVPIPFGKQLLVVLFQWIHATRTSRVFVKVLHCHGLATAKLTLSRDKPCSLLSTFRPWNNQLSCDQLGHVTTGWTFLRDHYILNIINRIVWIQAITEYMTSRLHPLVDRNATDQHCLGNRSLPLEGSLLGLFSSASVARWFLNAQQKTTTKSWPAIHTTARHIFALLLVSSRQFRDWLPNNFGKYNLVFLSSRGWEGEMKGLPGVCELPRLLRGGVGVWLWSNLTRKIVHRPTVHRWKVMSRAFNVAVSHTMMRPQQNGHIQFALPA